VNPSGATGNPATGNRQRCSSSPADLLAEVRDPALVHRFAHEIAARVTRPWRIMEVCGGQTHTIVQYAIDSVLPPEIELLHGPGCPVCVTPVERIDHAQRLACLPGVTLCSFGDMLRVPGSAGDLHAARARGGSIEIVYSPLDALEFARAHPERQVVFFAVGFETTAPATALCVARARAAEARNFSVLMAHVRVAPALSLLLQSPHAGIDGFLAAGHVCSVMGLDEYVEISARHRVPIVATGFEPADLLEGVLLCVAQLEEQRAEVENQYARAVSARGNAAARALLERVFRVEDRAWRGLGAVSGGALGLRDEFAEFDALSRFPLPARPPICESGCASDRVLRGEIKPVDCAAFATACRPEHPLGAPMVSDEGACAAYFRYRRSAAPRLAPQHSAGSASEEFASEEPTSEDPT